MIKNHPIHIVFLSFISVIFLLLVSCNPHEDAASQKPNILFILVDDLGMHDLSCTGSTYYETPNIDRIAASGVVFNQGYAASRVCSPSRASIMTGQFTVTHGITDWIGARSGQAWRENNRHDLLLPADYVHQLDPDKMTIAEALKATGYKTFYAGKWHLGEEGSYPEDHGFDINKGGWEKGSPIGGYYAPWTNPRLAHHIDGENLSMRLARETINFLDEYKDTTFFAVLSFYAVHGPIQTTREKWKKYRDKAEEQGIAEHGFQMERVLPIRVVQDNPVYAGLVETMDDAVGLVLNKLEALGLDDNTIVLFTSDNGGVASGDAFSTSNLPLRGGKGYQWEGGIRAPFFIKVPGRTKPTSSDYPVTGSDFYPTILELAGSRVNVPQKLDGISLVPILKGNEMSERALIWHYPHYGNQGGNPSSIIRKGDWKLISYYETESNELYNLKNDPSEQTDLSESQPDVVRELNEELQNMLKVNNAHFPARDQAYSKINADKRREWIRNEYILQLENKRMEYLSPDYDPKNDWWGSAVTRD